MTLKEQRRAIAVVLFLCAPACGLADEDPMDPGIGGEKAATAEESMMFGLTPTQFYAALSNMPLRTNGQDLVLEDSQGRGKVTLLLKDSPSLGDKTYELTVRTCVYGMILNRSCDESDFQETIKRTGIWRLEGREVLLYDNGSLLGSLRGFATVGRTPAAVLRLDPGSGLSRTIGSEIVLLPEASSIGPLSAARIDGYAAAAFYAELRAKYVPSRPQFKFDFVSSGFGSTLPWKSQVGEGQLSLYLFPDGSAVLVLNACTYDWRFHCYRSFLDESATFEGRWNVNEGYLEIQGVDGSPIATLSGYSAKNMGAVLTAGPDLAQYVGNYVAVGVAATSGVSIGLLERYYQSNQSAPK